jgi:hypothetical protein
MGSPLMIIPPFHGDEKEAGAMSPMNVARRDDGGDSDDAGGGDLATRLKRARANARRCSERTEQGAAFSIVADIAVAKVKFKRPVKEEAQR